MYHCGRPGVEGYGNAIDVTPGPGVSLDLDRVQASRRGTMTVSACGVCGRQSIQDLAERCPPVAPGPEVPSDLLLRICDQLPEMQPTFRATGGSHAAAAYTSSGGLLCCFEDVARHNAVDKVVGELLLTGRIGPPDDESGVLKPSILAVSGRLSFEIVQKAAVARMPIVASVSAASSLGADLARRLNVTLAGFVREQSYNIYTSPERIV